MNFTETELRGAFVIDTEPIGDERGSFVRTFCRSDFEARGLNPLVSQANVSMTRRRGAMRGLHFQFPPHAETKLVRCTRGAMFDVIVDLRPESPTYLAHVAIEVTAANRRAVYVPERFAHGFQVLDDGTETTYLMGAPYRPESAGGLRYSDPRLAIAWPLPATDLSTRDREWALLQDAEPYLRARMALPAPT